MGTVAPKRQRLRRLALPAGAALLLLAAFPPLGLWPLAWIAPGLLYACFDRPRRATLSAAAFALVVYGIGMHWLNEIGSLPWLATVLFQVVLYTLWGALCGQLLPRLAPARRPLAFAALWTLFEGFRSWGGYAFPWFVLAAAHTRPSALPWLQIVAITGQWGLSFAAAWAGGAMTEAVRARRLQPAIGPMALFVLLPLYGHFPRAALERDTAASVAKRRTIAVVQGSEDRGTQRAEALSLYSDLSRAAQEADLIVWPEGTVPGDPATRLALNQLARALRAPILVGMTEFGGDGLLRNQIRVFPEGANPPVYTKRQLVPFGEFFPARAVLDPILAQYGATYPDYLPGNAPGVFAVGELNVGVAICYESAFPYVARDCVRGGANVLAFVTSDQTFGKTVELQQHLDLASVRGVETHRWIARAGSTGISAIVWPDGRVLPRLSAGDRGALRGTVFVREDETLFVRWGEWFLWGCGMLLVGLLGFKERASPSAGSGARP